MDVIVEYENECFISIYEGEKILTALRGPDDCSYNMKILGSAVVRSYVKGFNYGLIVELPELYDALCYMDKDDLFTEAFDFKYESVSSHYIEHMAEAFEILECHCPNKEEKAFLRALRLFWEAMEITNNREFRLEEACDLVIREAKSY